jgi:hypothetical protein
MMGSTARGSHTATQTAIDLIAWTATQTAPEGCQVITWTESGYTPEAINPGIDARAEEVLKRDQYRQTAPKATPPELTPKERRERERLCKREAELAELWKQFESMPQAVNPYATRA